jgi:5-(carboxyamino)imidazole ribonucleotide synthase
MIKLAIIGTEKGPGQLGMLLGFAANKIHCSGLSHFKLLTVGENLHYDWADETFASSDSDLKTLLEEADLITFETESLSERFRENLNDKFVPSNQILHIFRNRLREKDFIRSVGLKTVEYYPIIQKNIPHELEKAILERQSEWLLKTCEFGYDGLGQYSFNTLDELKQLLTMFATEQELIVEKKIHFKRELSIVSARTTDGQIIHFPVPENQHIKGILYRSTKAELTAEELAKIQKINETILQKLDYIGTFCTELFEVDGDYFVNECAPRVHNSGHFTLEFCQLTNQFDAHIKAICGLTPEQPVNKHDYFSMTNIIGMTEDQFKILVMKLEDSDLIYGVESGFYWYNKEGARPKRKMGHITFTAHSIEQLRKLEKFVDEITAAFEGNFI